MVSSPRCRSAPCRGRSCCAHAAGGAPLAPCRKRVQARQRTQKYISNREVDLAAKRVGGTVLTRWTGLVLIMTLLTGYGVRGTGYGVRGTGYGVRGKGCSGAVPHDGRARCDPYDSLRVCGAQQQRRGAAGTGLYALAVAACLWRTASGGGGGLRDRKGTQSAVPSCSLLQTTGA